MQRLHHLGVILGLFLGPGPAAVSSFHHFVQLGILWDRRRRMGWLASSLCIQATAFSMAELCSSMPTAGGLYYASAVLAPDGWG